MHQDPSGKDEDGAVCNQLLVQREKRGDTGLKDRHKQRKDRNTGASGTRSGSKLAWSQFGTITLVMIPLIPTP